MPATSIDSKFNFSTSNKYSSYKELSAIVILWYYDDDEREENDFIIRLFKAGPVTVVHVPGQWHDGIGSDHRFGFRSDCNGRGPSQNGQVGSVGYSSLIVYPLLFSSFISHVEISFHERETWPSLKRNVQTRHWLSNLNRKPWIEFSKISWALDKSSDTLFRSCQSGALLSNSFWNVKASHTWTWWPKQIVLIIQNGGHDSLIKNLDPILMITFSLFESNGHYKLNDDEVNEIERKHLVRIRVA